MKYKIKLKARIITFLKIKQYHHDGNKNTSTKILISISIFISTIYATSFDLEKDFLFISLLEFVELIFELWFYKFLSDSYYGFTLYFFIKKSRIAFTLFFPLEYCFILLWCILHCSGVLVSFNKTDNYLKTLVPLLKL